MASFPIVSRYKEYKQDTNRLLQWLTQTASRCDNATEFLATLEQKAATRSDALDKAEVSFSVREFVDLAKLVAANPAVAIPKDIVDVAKRVVAKRESCAEYYQQSAYKKDGPTADDEGHSYFIKAIYQIHDILSAAREAQLASNLVDDHEHQQIPVQTTSDILSNLFLHLEVEEPTESSPDLVAEHATVAVEKKGPKDIQQADSGAWKRRDDTIFAVWCLLEDFSSIKEFVCQAWRDYVAGTKSLVASPAITETAFGRMRRAWEDFALAHHDIADYWQMIELMAPEGKNRFDADADPSGTGFIASGRVAELLCYQGGQLFAVLSAEIAKASPGKRIPEQSGIPCQLPDQKLAAILVKLLPSLLEVARDQDKSRFDEFLSALVAFVSGSESKVLPIWLVAAAQTYMEIVDILKGHNSCGLDALRASLQHFKRTIDKESEVWGGSEALKEHHDSTVPWSGLYNGLYDPEFLQKFDASDVVAMLSDTTVWDFPLYQARPLLAHMLPLYPYEFMYRMYHAMQYAGIQQINAGTNLLSLAHLYKAGRQYGLITAAWEDMDFVLANHVGIHPGRGRSNNLPVVTKPSKNADSYAMAKHFRMALGLPVAQLQRSARPVSPRHDALHLSARSLEPKLNLIDALAATAKNMSDSSRVAKDRIDVVLNTLADGGESKSKTSGKQFSYTPLSLLQAYEKHLKLDEPTLNFDYIGFKSFYLFWIVRLQSNHTTARTEKAKKDEHMFDFVDNMLWQAAEAVERAQNKSPEGVIEALKRTNFGRAVIQLNTDIEKDPERYNEYSKSAFSKSSGHIRKDMRPKSG